MTFGEKLKELRESRNMTQAELADALEMSNSAIGMYETNRREPSFEILETIADYFNVNMGYLVENKPNPDDDIWELREELAKNPNLRILFSASKGATNADLRAAAAMLDSLKNSR